MDPTSSKNLDMFRERYEKVQKYVLLPAHFKASPDQPELLFDLSIGKTEIRIVPAWQIGEHDPDAIGIQDDTNPIIPEGVENPPVISALARFERHRHEDQVMLSPEFSKFVNSDTEAGKVPNVRAKRATTAGRQARAGENVPRTSRPGLVTCRWRSA